MKIEILQENLAKAITAVSHISSGSGQLPILNTVLLVASKEGITFSATNLELSVNYWVGGKVLKEGRTAIPVKQLAEAINLLPKEKVVLEKEDNQITIICQQTKIKLNVSPAEEFPHIPTAKSSQGTQSIIDFEQQEIKECISKVTIAASEDESRAVLNGVMFKFRSSQMEVVATDGYRLSLYRIDKKAKAPLPEKPIIIPSRALIELGRILGGGEEKIKMALEKKENQAIFTVEGVELITRLIDGEFPDYEKIIPAEEGEKIEIDREEAERAVKLTAVFARESANIVRMKLNEGELLIEADAPQVGQGSSRLMVSCKKQSLAIAFNFRFLSDMLRSISTQQVVFSFQDELKPGLFLEKGNPRYLHLIMPVRIQEEIKQK